jgi:perosamine synthetase
MGCKASSGPFNHYEGDVEMSKELSWRFRGNEFSYINEVLVNGFKASADGAFSARLEEKFAQIHGQSYAIAFNSGTTTLHSILLALGIKSGDEVVVPSLTPLMCGLSIHYTGATPVYADVDQETFLITPESITINISEKTKAILVVHMYGAVCDMPRIMEIARQNNLFVVEDCAQSHMGLDSLGRKTGTIGDAGSWSFENSKQITCGDGGIVTTNSPDLALKIRKIGGLGFKTLTANSGKVRTEKDKLQNPNWERFDAIGYNYRMNQLAAAVALAQIERWEYFINLRRLAGAKYLESIRGSSLLEPQKNIPGTTNSYFTFSSRFISDENLSWMEFRQKYVEFGGDGIYSAAKLLYQEPIFSELKIGKGTTPIAEKLQKQIMNFTTNQSSEIEVDIQCEIMLKTRKYFGDI